MAKCHICGKDIRAKNMKYHLKLHTEGAPKLPCSVCGKEFTSVGTKKR